MKLIKRALLTSSLLFIVLVIASPDSIAEVYKWVDENGRTHYGDKPPENQDSKVNSSIYRPITGSQTVEIYGGSHRSIVIRIRDRFKNRDFNGVDKILAKLHLANRSDISNEVQLSTAYSAYEFNDDSYIPLFSEWIELSPNNFRAYLAKAHFLFRLGWKSRGSKRSNQTTSVQFAEMNEYFNRAIIELNKTIAINPKTILPYCLLIGIDKARGNESSIKQHFESGLSVQPSSYLLRKYYSDTLKPRWGGSISQMRAFSDNAQFYVKKNRKIKQLKGEWLAESGYLAYSKKQYQKAIKLYEQALNFGDNANFYFLRGKAYYRQKNYSKALRDFNKTIAIKPDIGQYYNWRHYTHVKTKKFSEALKDIKRASLLEINDAEIDNNLTKLLSRISVPGTGKEPTNQSEFESELNQLNLKIQTSPNNSYLYYKKGHYLLSNNELVEAETPLKKSISLSPTEFEYYRLLDLILFKQGKLDEIIGYWNDYLKLKPKDGRAYLERAGTYYHMQDYSRSKRDARKALDLGTKEAQKLYDKLLKY